MPLAGEIPEPTFFGDPRSLWYLALAEAWRTFLLPRHAVVACPLRDQVSPAARTVKGIFADAFLQFRGVLVDRRDRRSRAQTELPARIPSMRERLSRV